MNDEQHGTPADNQRPQRAADASPVPPTDAGRMTRRTFVHGAVAGAAVVGIGRYGQALADVTINFHEVADASLIGEKKVVSVTFQQGRAGSMAVASLIPGLPAGFAISRYGPPLPQGVTFDAVGRQFVYDGVGPAGSSKGQILVVHNQQLMKTAPFAVVVAAVAAPPAASGWSFKQQAAGGPPYANGCKHTALLYDPVTHQIIQCGGDFNGGSETAPNGAVWSHGATRRDMWAADARNPTLSWSKVQPMFMPAGQTQGPFLGPDQVWFWRRSAVEPPEIWVGPGAYRPHVSHVPYMPYEGEQGVAFKWLRPGWHRPITQRMKVAINGFKDPVKQFPRQFGDSGVPDKFCAYDPVTDAAYCINDNWEIIKWDHARNDWDHVPSGNGYVNLHGNAVDDQGRPLKGAAEISIGGSHQACVGRRIYALCKWRNPGNNDVRSYLAWFDIDSQKVGAITCPFDIDPAWPVPGGRNPEESSMLCALNGKLVVCAMTYFGIPAGGRPIWIYDPATLQWQNGDPVPEWIGGNTVVAVPDQNAICLMGSTANPSTADGGWNKVAVYTLPGGPGGSVPPPAGGVTAGVLTYTQTKTGPFKNFATFHDLVVDANGRPVWGGPNTHSGYGRGENALWRYDPDKDVVETIYPDNGNKQGWVGTDNFVRFVIPGYNWYLQNFTVLFDLNTNKIVASNIVSAKEAAGINDSDTTPGWADVFEAEGKLALGNPSKPYMAAHDWCNAQDVGIMLGGLHTPELATLIWKNPDYPAKSTRPLRIKCVYMPLSSRHPDTLTWANRAQSNGKCRGDWLYVFGANYQLKGSGNKAMRLHVPTFMATRADTRVADSACEFLPDMQGVFPNGVGYVAANGVTYDSDKDRFLIFNYEVLEFDPLTNLYSKVTPAGFPKGLAGVNCAYDPTRKAHWLMGGQLASVTPSLALPAPPMSPPFSNGSPTYAIYGRFHRVKYA